MYNIYNIHINYMVDIILGSLESKPEGSDAFLAAWFNGRSLGKWEAKKPRNGKWEERVMGKEAGSMGRKWDEKRGEREENIHARRWIAFSNNATLLVLLQREKPAWWLNATMRIFPKRGKTRDEACSRKLVHTCLPAHRTPSMGASPVETKSWRLLF